jgi:Rrf2 family protein
LIAQSTRTAIAAVSRLAELYDGGATLVSAADIAENRKLKRPFVGKVLSELSRVGIVRSSTGPGGGFTLAVDPSEVTLGDVIQLFERTKVGANCPFGGGICGVGDACPLHDEFKRAQAVMNEFYAKTTFELFRNR